MNKYLRMLIKAISNSTERFYIVITTPIMAWLLYLHPSYDINVFSPIIICSFSLIWIINKRMESRQNNETSQKKILQEVQESQES